MDSSEDEGLFITQSSTKGDISAEIEGNVVLCNPSNNDLAKLKAHDSLQ